MDPRILRFVCYSTLLAVVSTSSQISHAKFNNDDNDNAKLKKADSSLVHKDKRIMNTIVNIQEYPSNQKPSGRELIKATHNSTISSEYRHPVRRKRLVGESGEVILQERFPARVVAPGSNVNILLSCSATGAERLIWGRDGRPLPPHLQPIALYHPTEKDLLRTMLNISHVSSEDAGLYSCTAVSRDNTSSAHHSARIDVYGSPYIRLIGPVKAVTGSRVVIHCPYYGYPISKIQWDHNGKLIGSDFNIQSMYKRSLEYHNNTKILQLKKKGHGQTGTLRRYKRGFMSNEEGVLVIDNVLPEENAGLYTCSVSNPSGEMARRSFELVVIEPPVLEEFSFATNLQEGQIAQVTCSVRSGDTPIYFSWLKDGAPIPTTLKVEEKNSDLFSVLLIKKVKLQHCGIYTCIASNHAARVNQSAELFVKVAPKWISEPQNISIVIGKSGYIVCSANGYPQPQVHWMKKDENLGSWRPVLELRGSGILSFPNGTLLFELVTFTHEGLYSCTVDNGVPQPLNKVISVSINKPVSFEIDSKNITVRKGYPVTISCEAFGDHPIRTAWKFNGRILEYMSKRIRITNHQTTRGSVSELFLGVSNTDDAGHYQCDATNPHGNALQIINLIIQEPPSMPFEFAIEAVWSRAIHLSWHSPTSFPIPHSFMLQYKIHNHPSTNYWEKALILNFTNISNQQKQKGEITGLVPATQYTARICSVGDLDLSPFTHPLVFTTLEEAPEAPPTGISAEATSNPGELRISWLPPSPHTLNGVLLGYIIKVIPQINDQAEENTKILKISSLDDHVPQHAVLSGLLKSTRYAISMCCYNSVGQGPFSSNHYHLTREGIPEVAPTPVECTSVSSTALRVSWRHLPQHLQGGAMLGYILFYTTSDGYQQNLTTIHSEIYLQGLLKFTNYTIEVGGYCSQGMGPLSSSIFCTTMQDIPSSPTEIKAMPLSSDAIIISWKPPLHPNGRIIHYTVYTKSSLNEGATQSYHVPVNINQNYLPKTITQPLRQLQEGRSYEGWVTATSGAGEGEPSRRVIAEPTDRVMAGIASLNSDIWTGVGKSLHLECYAVGNPQPRTIWYHNNHIITHHPRFIFNKDDSLLISNIDQSLEGNYTCLAKNLYGSDKVEYLVGVLPIPNPPTLRLINSADSILVEWTTPSIMNSHISTRFSNHTTKILGYLVSWRENEGKWSKNEELGMNTYKKLIKGLHCATVYEIRVIAKSTMGESLPATGRSRTLGAVLTAPLGSQWIWSNATTFILQTDSWGRSDCGVARWSIDYRQVPTKLWLRSTTLQEVGGWGQLFVVSLIPGQWYQLRVTATNAAGTTTALYNMATKTIKGEEIGPYSEPLDTSFLVIVCSSVLLILSIIVCIIAAVQKHRHKLMCGTMTNDLYKESRMPPTPPNFPDTEPPPCPRLYSSPISTRKPSKTNTEMFEISPYAQFTMGFQTFGHTDNQDRPGYIKKNHSYNTDTSFQGCSESDDSDSFSKSTTIVKAPNKMCRVQYHR